jgi:hypothetical protein
MSFAYDSSDEEWDIQEEEEMTMLWAIPERRGRSMVVPFLVDRNCGEGG